jgi:hypothetical protein
MIVLGIAWVYCCEDTQYWRHNIDDSKLSPEVQAKLKELAADEEFDWVNDGPTKTIPPEVWACEVGFREAIDGDTWEAMEYSFEGVVC